MFALTSKQEGSMSLRGFMQSGAWGRLHHFQLGGKAKIIYQKKIDMIPLISYDLPDWL